MRRTLVYPVLLTLAFIMNGPAIAEEVSWKSQVQELGKRVARGSLGDDFALSFQYNFLNYTVKGTGEGVMESGKEKKEFKVPRDELLALCGRLLGHKLDGFSEQGMIYDAPTFTVTIKTGDSTASRSAFYDAHRTELTVVWQYLFRFGQYLAGRCGLPGPSPMPVCEGITGYEEVDEDKDGMIDWVKIKVGFYVFKAQDAEVELNGSAYRFALPLGGSEREYFFNAYSLRDAGKECYITLVSDDEHFVGVLDLSGILKDKPKFRTTPDIVLKQNGFGTRDKVSFRFKVFVNQAVVVDILSGYPFPRKEFFTLKEVSGDKVTLDSGNSLREMEKGRATHPSYGYFSLVETGDKSAVFEIVLANPLKEIELFDADIRRIKEQLISGRGDRDELERQLKLAEYSREGLVSYQKGRLEAVINYSTPPVERIPAPEFDVSR